MKSLWLNRDEGVCDVVSQAVPASLIRGAAIAGMVLFGGTAWVLRGGWFWLSWWTLLGPVLLFPLIVFHETVHWAAFRWFGVNARFSWTKSQTNPSVSGQGEWMGRGQYAVVALAPSVLVSGLGVVAMAIVPPLCGAFALALVLHLTGCVSDWRVLGAVLVLPRGTLIKDGENAFVYRVPKK